MLVTLSQLYPTAGSHTRGNAGQGRAFGRKSVEALESCTLDTEEVLADGKTRFCCLPASVVFSFILFHRWLPGWVWPGRRLSSMNAKIDADIRIMKQRNGDIPEVMTEFPHSRGFEHQLSSSKQQIYLFICVTWLEKESPERGSFHFNPCVILDLFLPLI